ncbi:PREDICTED: uncharacterized protein C16orf92 homolog [Miniopterus natalensis]|uniref:uncharacterized protein C16orf92 homolog n=1 Tax=Miniopterus natalensis TaxID=291302 RepID=UPI0007A6EB9E|nr:PREDICTED: uncharacterized protein C16orf92 homolog [Miniopterus natalensis]
MSLWQWARVWVWLVGLGAIDTAPSPESAKTSALGTELLDFINRRKFFDYPDSDEAKILAVAQFIQEEPVFFANAGPSNATIFRRLLVGILTAAFFFFLFQFCTHA